MLYEDFEKYEVQKEKEISNICHNMNLYSETKKAGEIELEEYRLKKCPDQQSRIDSIFVFPNDDITGRVCHWAMKYVSTPGKSVQCMLVTAEVESDITWHDSTYFEDICHIMANEQFLVCHKGMNINDLCEAYWKHSGCEGIETEGLVPRMKVINVESCFVSRNKISFPEREK